VGAKASELKSCVVWLAIDKDKGMIMMAGQEWGVGRQQV
jgi:hypothetical protein